MDEGERAVNLVGVKRASDYSWLKRVLEFMNA